MTNAVSILGIDPGSRFTGYGIVVCDGQSSKHIASGCIRAGSGEFNQRLKIIFDGVQEVVETHRPEVIAVEQVFVSRSVSSALKLGQARGAALAAALSYALPVFEYAPTQVKRAITGQGHADKVQVQHMVKLLIGLHQTLNADQADALAVALCHAHHTATASRLATASAARPATKNATSRRRQISK